jgi:hypothetical protein
VLVVAREVAIACMGGGLKATGEISVQLTANVRAERLAAAGRLGGETQHKRWAARRPGGLPWTVRSRARG